MISFIYDDQVYKFESLYEAIDNLDRWGVPSVLIEAIRFELDESSCFNIDDDI